jgi:hypothetical protein
MKIDVPTIIVNIQKLNRNRQQHRSNKRQRRRAHQTALTCLEHARPRPEPQETPKSTNGLLQLPSE